MAALGVPNKSRTTFIKGIQQINGALSKRPGFEHTKTRSERLLNERATLFNYRVAFYGNSNPKYWPSLVYYRLW